MTTSLTAVGTIILGLIAYRLSVSSTRYAAQRAIGDLYNTMAGIRATYPECLQWAREWSPELWSLMYGSTHQTRRVELVRYYSYLEAGLEFCNSALAARAEKQISRSVYEQHYRRLIRHFVAQNWPCLSSILDSPYLSDYLRQEIGSAQKEGWDWGQRHAALMGHLPTTGAPA